MHGRHEKASVFVVSSGRRRVVKLLLTFIPVVVVVFLVSSLSGDLGVYLTREADSTMSFRELIQELEEKGSTGHKTTLGMMREENSSLRDPPYLEADLAKLRLDNTSVGAIEETDRRKDGSATATSKFAYAFVIGGCDPDNPRYVNYIYDILISTYIQRQDGSTADVIVLFQMSYESKHDELTTEDVRLLNSMRISFQYIPKSADESFYNIMLDKFRVLDLTQYSRILFLDGDVVSSR
jgi:hypothetical protein